MNTTSKMTTSSLANYCTINNINWFPIHLTINKVEGKNAKLLEKIMHPLYKGFNQKGEVVWRPMMTDFQTLDNATIKARQELLNDPDWCDELNYIAMDTTFVKQIDIDSPDYPEGFDKIMEQTPYFKSMTKSYGRHILIKFDDYEVQSNRMQFACNRDAEGDIKKIKVELLAGQWSYAPNEIYNADKEILTISNIKEMLTINENKIIIPSSPTTIVNQPHEFPITNNIVTINDSKFYNELKYLAENGAFANCVAPHQHEEFIKLAGMLISVLPYEQAFECWEIAILRDGTPNKKNIYKTKIKDIKQLMNDPDKAMNSLRKNIKKTYPTIYDNWKQLQNKQETEWRLKVKEDIKALKESKHQEKLEERNEKVAIRQQKIDEKNAIRQQKTDNKDKEALAIETRKQNHTFVDNDNDACDIVMKLLKGIIIFVGEKYYYKYENCWINNKHTINALLLKFITECEIYRWNEDYNLSPYVQNTNTAKHVLELLYAKIMVEKCDVKYSTFHSSTKKKLCFQDGVLDFKTKKFTLWEDITEPIFTTITIKRNFQEYFNNPNRFYIDSIKNDILGNLFGDKTDLALKFFSRSIAGCCEDKNFMSYSGNRNCGKGIFYTAMAASLEDYVTSFNLENMVCKRESNKSSDIAKENAWLLPFEFSRIAIAQETDENENDNIKTSLKISNKMMKSIMSGGDELIARPLYCDPIKITLDVTLGFFGNNELSISGEDSGQHHFKFNGVKQFVTQEKYDSFDGMGKDFISAYAVRDETLKDKIKTDEYMNAMVYLLFENYQDKCLTINAVDNDDGEQYELSIRALIFKHYEITKDDKDRVGKDDLIQLIKKDKKKILAELKQLGCVGDDKCRTTVEIEIEKENGEKEKKSKQIQAFKNIKLRTIVTVE